MSAVVVRILDVIYTQGAGHQRRDRALSTGYIVICGGCRWRVSRLIDQQVPNLAHAVRWITNFQLVAVSPGPGMFPGGQFPHISVFTVRASIDRDAELRRTCWTPGCRTHLGTWRGVTMSYNALRTWLESPDTPCKIAQGLYEYVRKPQVSRTFLRIGKIFRGDYNNDV